MADKRETRPVVHGRRLSPQEIAQRFGAEKRRVEEGARRRALQKSRIEVREATEAFLNNQRPTEISVGLASAFEKALDKGALPRVVKGEKGRFASVAKIVKGEK